MLLFFFARCTLKWPEHKYCKDDATWHLKLWVIACTSVGYVCLVAANSDCGSHNILVGKLIGQDGRSIVGNKNFKPLCMWCCSSNSTGASPHNSRLKPKASLRRPRHMISVEKMLGNPPRIACASLLAGHASRSPHWHFELLGIAQKQRLLRYSTLQYTKYCGGLAPCIRYLLANFPAFWFIRDARINFESIRLWSFWHQVCRSNASSKAR